AAICVLADVDKAKLSSFGTKKSYPVVAHCTNLPTEIWNGNGIGGRRVVRWLPIVPEDAADIKNHAFVDFKQRVWHRAFHCIIESIIEKSKVGCWLQDANGIQTQYFPGITILSADYEEQHILLLSFSIAVADPDILLAHLWGGHGKWPCPVCLAPLEKLADLSATWKPRTVGHMQKIIKEAKALGRKDCKKLLQAFGICNVDNMFWLVNNLDLHHALSFDRLHSNNSSLFGYHLWDLFKAVVSQIEHSTWGKVDQQYYF
ncbi:hypothetical protein V8E53_014116, partial [Lactarius tabidus]